MSVAVPTQPHVAARIADRGWLRSVPFDLSFIVIAALLALTTGYAAMVQPRLFGWVLFVDVWFLGYHHVVSTFTRLTFDSDSFKQHRFLVIQLPLIVLGATVAAVLVFGYWVLPTVYLYWQWFHYTRQSYGIERIYRRKADPQTAIGDYVTTRNLYLLPLFGILYRSYQAQPTFLNMQMKYLPIHPILLGVVGGVAIVAMAWWAVQQVIACWQGRLAYAHTLYLLSHHAIFVTGYILIDDITTGWLVLNVWHNVQYILLVWSVNNRRFKDGVDPKHRFLSTISQQRHVLVYFGLCMAIATTVAYLLEYATTPVATATAVPLTLIAFMVINFHHYVDDGIIWKVRKPALQKTLDIAR